MKVGRSKVWDIDLDVPKGKLKFIAQILSLNMIIHADY
jgi:hypothetical protein